MRSIMNLKLKKNKKKKKGENLEVVIPIWRSKQK